MTYVTLPRMGLRYGHGTGYDRTMSITETATQTAHDYTDADTLYAHDPRYVSEHEFALPAGCEGDPFACTMVLSYEGCSRCLGEGCYRCEYIMCEAHE